MTGKPSKSIEQPSEKLAFKEAKRRVVEEFERNLYLEVTQEAQGKHHSSSKGCPEEQTGFLATHQEIQHCGN